MSKKKEYTVVCYMKVIPDDMEEMTLADAKKEQAQQRMMQPEHLWRIEEVSDLMEESNDVV